jgi:dTDP-3-amino-3,4,6-trideoxy-alpha-D-glucose transaminase
MMAVPFVDLRPGDDAGEVRAAIDRVIERGWFVLGPEVEAFEQEFASASGAAHAVGVANGTDAIALLLRASGIGPGDEVLVPAMTAAFTGLAVQMIGAHPRFVDVDASTLTMDAGACAAAVTSRTRAIVPVHLYGQAADLDGLLPIAARHNLLVVEDCCQAHMATGGGIPVGTRGLGGAFSFYPTKNLGALGDGGAIITNDASLADRVRRLRNGGQTTRYLHTEPGINSRLDELQAAILRVKLQHLPAATAKRRELAAAYRAHLPASIATIAERDPGHVYHLFPVRSPERDALQAHLRASGIETLIHYPVALQDQPAFRSPAAVSSGNPEAACPAAALAARELLSLPLHPRLSLTDITFVAAAIDMFLKGRPTP